MATVLLATATPGAANTLSPGSQKEIVTSNPHHKTYTIQNTYDYPATLELFVYDKDFKEVDGWAVEKKVFKLLPKGKREVLFSFEVDEVKKLHVCSKMVSKGYEQVPLAVTTQVCSRLMLIPQ